MRFRTILPFSIIPFIVIFSQANSELPSEISIWPGTAPGSENVQIERFVKERAAEGELPNRIMSSITDPKLEVFAPEKPNGTSMIICPGGGYRYLAYDKEGVDTAQMLNKAGVTAFVLSYRLPSEGHEKGYWAPLQDAQRAMRTVRSNAEKWELDPARIGIMGFSAGGHLASTLGTHFETHCYEAVDAIDNISARPDFMALIYPVVSMEPDVTHMGSRTLLLGENPEFSMEKQFTNALHVDEKTPPTFFTLASDDGAVIPENSIQFLQALLKAGVPVEFHCFQKGGHGFGLRYNPGTTHYWPELLTSWLETGLE